MNRRVYLGRCLECNCAMYWNESEEKLVTTSNIPDHQCELKDRKEDNDDDITMFKN